MSIDYSLGSVEHNSMSIETSGNTSLMSIDYSLGSNIEHSSMSIDSSAVQQGIPPLSDITHHVSNIMEQGWFPCTNMNDRIMTLATWLQNNNNVDPTFYHSIYSDFLTSGPLSRTFGLMEIFWSAWPVHF